MFFTKNNIIKFFLSFFIISMLFDIIYFDIVNIDYIRNSIENSYLYVIPEGHSCDKDVDPVRYWPSGVPQSWSIVGTGLATYTALSRLNNCSPRMRVLGALGSIGVSISTVFYQSAIENPVGFNRFMYGLSIYNKKSSWPSLEEIKQNVSDKDLDNFVKNNIAKADTSVVNQTVSEVKSKIDTNKILPDNSTEFLDKLLDRLFDTIISILKPVNVEGYLDDLIGQRILIHIILFILVISLILLFLFYLFNNIIVLNRDKILSKFNNKYILYFIKYQLLLAKFSTIYAPILIIIGLLVLSHGLYFLIVNQIPYEYLDIDLHTYVSSKK